MSDKKCNVPLRLFIYGLIDLIKDHQQMNVKTVEENLLSGIATFLYRKYSDVFEKVDFNQENILDIDEYFRKWLGVASDVEDRKYNCCDDDGICLLIKLALNDII